MKNIAMEGLTSSKHLLVSAAFGVKVRRLFIVAHPVSAMTEGRA